MVIGPQNVWCQPSVQASSSIAAENAPMTRTVRRMRGGSVPTKSRTNPIQIGGMAQTPRDLIFRGRILNSISPAVGFPALGVLHWPMGPTTSAYQPAHPPRRGGTPEAAVGRRAHGPAKTA